MRFTYLIYCLLLLAWPGLLEAQPYELGHSTISFYDAARSNREVETEVYYPADVAGDDVAIASGQFPVVVFGHGFVISASSYENFYSTLVPEGYIMLIPNTEDGFSPSHETFGEDLAFLVDEMLVQNADAGSFFYQAISGSSAVLGHSMGGGSSFLATASNPNVNTIITYAAAETDPSAIDAAANITVPGLVFSGLDDGVAPPDENQVPMYDALNSDCKTYIGIIDGGHCNFGGWSFYCNLVESSSDMPMEEQHEITLFYTLNWLNYYLKADQTANDLFQDSLDASSRVMYEQYCPTSNIVSIQEDEILVQPNPFSEYITIQLPKSDKMNEIEIYDLAGNVVRQEAISKGDMLKISTSALKSGVYFVKQKNSPQVKKVIKL
jgi:predicted dienelactone hydrolase